MQRTEGPASRSFGGLGFLRHSLQGSAVRGCPCGAASALVCAPKFPRESDGDRWNDSFLPPSTPVLWPWYRINRFPFFHPATLTGGRLLLRAEQYLPGTWISTFPGHREQHWPKSLTFFPLEGQVPKDPPTPLSRDSKDPAQTRSYLRSGQTSLIHHRALSTEPRPSFSLSRHSRYLLIHQKRLGRNWLAWEVPSHKNPATQRGRPGHSGPRPSREVPSELAVGLGVFLLLFFKNYFSG